MLPENWLPRLESEIRALGAFQLEGWRLGGERQVKHDAVAGESVVTHYDVESERRLREFLLNEHPSHSFLGEESGHTRGDPDHYWIVDPIDGTTNFTTALPFWGPSVAYWEKGRPEFALVYFPALDELFTARRGGGAFLNGRRLHTVSTTEYSMLTTVALHSRSHIKHALRLRTKVRVVGSVIANMCYLARGSFLACTGGGRLWDLAAGILVMQEAGAVSSLQPTLPDTELATFAEERAHQVIFDLEARANASLPPLRDFLQPLPGPSPQQHTTP